MEIIHRENWGTPSAKNLENHKGNFLATHSRLGEPTQFLNTKLFNKKARGNTTHRENRGTPSAKNLENHKGNFLTTHSRLGEPTHLLNTKLFKKRRGKIQHIEKTGERPAPKIWKTTKATFWQRTHG